MTTRTIHRGLLPFIVALIAVPAFSSPEPNDILRSSLALIGNAKRIRVQTSVMSDDVVATGQKLGRSSDGTIAIRRPDGLRVDIVADRYRRTIQYDGKVLAVSDPDQKFYATFDAPATVDATVAAVKEKLGLDLPLSQLFAENAYDVLSSPGRIGTYVGIHRVRGTRCHHLAYSQDNVDWQIWIAAEGPPLPRKISIDFKNRPGRPQYTALLLDWNLAAELVPDDFRFSPPAGAQQIEFVKPGGGSQ